MRSGISTSRTNLTSLTGLLAGFSGVPVRSVTLVGLVGPIRTAGGRCRIRQNGLGEVPPRPTWPANRQVGQECPPGPECAPPATGPAPCRSGAVLGVAGPHGAGPGAGPGTHRAGLQPALATRPHGGNRTWVRIPPWRGGIAYLNRRSEVSNAPTYGAVRRHGAGAPLSRPLEVTQIELRFTESNVCSTTP